MNAGGDAESALRTRVLEFMADVRAAEIAVTAARRGRDGAGRDSTTPAVVTDISAEEWREHWMDCDAAGIPRALVHWPDDPE